MTSAGYIDTGAILSKDGRYRYLLWREWRGTHDPENWRWYGVNDGNGVPMGEPLACLFIMLNPSTADGDQDDPTIRRCVAFAKRWNYERLEVVNLFAHRATNPAELLALGYADDPVGPENLSKVQAATSKAGLIVCAWGAHGGHLEQDQTLLGWIDGEPLHVLGLTASGAPRHPLYLRADSRPAPWSPR